MPDNGRRLDAVRTTASVSAPLRVRMLVVDDSEAVRDGLTLLFRSQPSCELVGAVGDPAAALELTRAARPHVVLQDFSMPGVDTLGLMRALAACDPAPAVLVLSAFVDGPSALEATAAGAVGWVLKDAEPDELLAAVFDVAGLGAARLGAEPETAPEGGTRPPAAAPGSALPPRPDFEVATPLDARTLWALLRGLDTDPQGLTVAQLALQAIVPAPLTARYVQRMAGRHPALATATGMTAEGPRYALTPAGHCELARLEGRAAASCGHAATRLLR